MTKKILYISYDGMTDPLGQSQVLPYIKGLSDAGYQFTLISFEKPDRHAALKQRIEQYCQASHIDWVPLNFTSKPPILSKIWDLFRLKNKVKALHKIKSFDLVHCRSYVSAEGGLFLKRKYGVKFLFDIRGFWVDERVDGGLWNLSNPFFKMLYKHYKNKEKLFFSYADHVITLTEASIPYLRDIQKLEPKNLTVIPCASDFDLFQIPTAEQKARARNDLGIDKDSMVLSYLGSIGTWYLLDEMLMFFKCVKEKFDTALFLFITPEPADQILKSAKKIGLNSEDFIIRKAQRNEVFHYMAASDISIYFIKQCFSKISSSPTKLGEILAMGLPVITNTKIGDAEITISPTKNGYLINDFSTQSFDFAVKKIEDLLLLDHQKIREDAKQMYHLDSAIDKYKRCYKELFNE